MIPRDEAMAFLESHGVKVHTEKVFQVRFNINDISIYRYATTEDGKIIVDQNLREPQIEIEVIPFV